MAGFGLALAQAAAHGGKFQYKSNILSTERRAVLQHELSAHEWGHLDFIIHGPFVCILWFGDGVSDHENHSKGTKTLNYVK